VDGLAAYLGDVLRETHTGETGGEPGAERGRVAALIPDRVAEDLANLFFRAPTMATSTEAELLFHVVVELPYQELAHEINDITISSA
jgi:hypothetical protein